MFTDWILKSSVQRLIFRFWISLHCSITWSSLACLNRSDVINHNVHTSMCKHNQSTLVQSKAIQSRVLALAFEFCEKLNRSKMNKESEQNNNMNRRSWIFKQHEKLDSVLAEHCETVHSAIQSKNKKFTRTWYKWERLRGASCAWDKINKSKRQQQQQKIEE